MTERESVQQRLLRFLPGVALMAFATVGGAWALWFHDQEFSSLDNRYLAEFEYPTAASLADKSWMDSFDQYVDDRVTGRVTWLEIHALVTSRVLRDPVLNGVYLDATGGHLLEKPLRQPFRESLDEEAQSLTDAVEATGAQMLWVYAPRREEVFADELPEAWANPYLARRHDVVDSFQSTGARVLDLTDELADPLSREANYFLTDHHWTGDGALAATDAITGTLHDMGVTLGTDNRDYVRRSSQYGFVGSLGREVTRGVAQPEPFDYLEPNGGWNSRICGPSACDVSPLYERYLNDPGRYVNRYLAWIGGDEGLVRLYNESADAEGTVVLIKDSYGNPVATYLGERVRNLYVVDERHYEGDALADLLLDISPDAVVTMHNQVSLLSDAFESDVWTAPATQQSRADGADAEVATYEGGAVVSQEGLILSNVPRQQVSSTLAHDSQALVAALDPLDIPVS